MNETTTAAAIAQPSVPPCPSWCEAHGPQDRDWEITRYAATRTCRMSFRGFAYTPPGEDDLPDVSLERFADTRDGHVNIYRPEIRIDGGDALTVAQTSAVGHLLLRLVALDREDQAAVLTARGAGDAGGAAARPRRLGVVRRMSEPDES